MTRAIESKASLPTSTDFDIEARILILEDMPSDAELIIRQLRRTRLNCITRWVDNRADYCRELEAFTPDLILSDFTLPDFDGLSALALARQKLPAAPFIFVSGTIGEEQAVTAMKQGAADFLLKDRLARLGPAVLQVLERKRLTEEKAQAQAALAANEILKRAVLDSLRSHIAVLNRDGSIIAVNHAWERFHQGLHYSGVGMNYLKVWYGNGGVDMITRETAHRGIEAVLTGNSDEFALEYSCLLSGEQCWFQMRVMPLTDNSGGAVVAHEDITERKRAEQALRRQRDELAARNRIIGALVRSLDLDERLQRILDETMVLFGIECGVIYLMEEHRLVPRTWRGFSVESSPSTLTAPFESLGDWRTTPIVLHEHLLKQHIVPEHLRREGIQILIQMPLTMLQPAAENESTPELLGLLELASRHLHSFSKQNLHTLQTIGEQLALAIDHARRYREAQRRLERLRVLRENDRAILDSQSPEQTARAAIRGLRRLAPCQRVCLLQIDPHTGQARQLAAKGIGEPIFGNDSGRAEDIVGDLDRFRRHRLHAVADLQKHAASAALKAQMRYGVRSYFSVPLIVDSSLIGALNLWWTHCHGFTAESIDIAHEVADSLAVAIRQSWLYEQVQAGRQRLEVLSRQLLETQESERRHIARELHDEIGQALTVLKLNLRALQSTHPNPPPPQLTDSFTILNQIQKQVRQMALDLRPSILDDLGLAAALRWMVDHQVQLAGLRTQVVIDEFAPNALPPQIATACFRVAQEAITNAIRYASAHLLRVEMHLQYPELHLIVRDDGVGFDVNSARERAVRGGSLGLLSMEERVSLLFGKLEITSVPGRGTEIHARFPLTAEPIERRNRTMKLSEANS